MLLDLSALDLIGLTCASLFGFIAGKIRKQRQNAKSGAAKDLERAREIVNEFEGIAKQLNQAMQSHQRSVFQFKERLNGVSNGRPEAEWANLSAETERILRPTLALADQVARAYDQLKQQSNMLLNLQESRIDPLTGVGNRRMFNDAYAAQFALYHRYGTAFTLIMIDIDHFKQMNDTRGHMYGDQVLGSLGKLLAEMARETDQVARYGGEEFTIIAPETTRPGAAIFADRLRQKIEDELAITVSIGVAATDDFGQTDALLEAADKALYAAKEAGRNRVNISLADAIVTCESILADVDDGSSEVSDTAELVAAPE